MILGLGRPFSSFCLPHSIAYQTAQHRREASSVDIESRSAHHRLLSSLGWEGALQKLKRFVGGRVRPPSRDAHGNQRRQNPTIVGQNSLQMTRHARSLVQISYPHDKACLHTKKSAIAVQNKYLQANEETADLALWNATDNQARRGALGKSRLSNRFYILTSFSNQKPATSSASGLF